MNGNDNVINGNFPAAPQEDGPALQKLFAAVDQAHPYETVVPSVIADMVGSKPACAVEDADPVDSPVHYAHKLHEAGEAAISIVANMVESEFAMGNPRNVPEPIMGWYAMTLCYQLIMLEVCSAEHEKCASWANQLEAARRTMRHHVSVYSHGVQLEIDEALRDRLPLLQKLRGADYDHTYEGKL